MSAKKYSQEDYMSLRTRLENLEQQKGVVSQTGDEITRLCCEYGVGIFVNDEYAVASFSKGVKDYHFEERIEYHGGDKQRAFRTAVIRAAIASLSERAASEGIG
jgi:hypothetical protein